MQSPCLVAMYVYFLHANIRAQGLSYISSDGNHSSESSDRQDVEPESVGGVDGLGDDAGRGGEAGAEDEVQLREDEAGVSARLPGDPVWPGV